MRMAEYIFLECERKSWGPHKLVCTSLSLLVMGVMLLFCLTTRVDLLLTDGVHSLSRLSRLSTLLSWQAAITGVVYEGVGLFVVGVLLSESESEMSKSFELLCILAESYLLLEVSRLILFVSLDTLTTWALLAYPNLWCHSLIHLSWLTK